MKIGDYELAEFEIEYLVATEKYLQKWGNILDRRLEETDGKFRPVGYNFVEFAKAEYEKIIKNPKYSIKLNTEDISVNRIDEQKIKTYLAALINIHNNLDIPRILK